jgi:hypothetical protein
MGEEAILQDKSASRVITARGVRDEYLVGISTQRRMRAEGRFVPWYLAGNRVVYRRELVERWVEEQESKTTAASSTAPPADQIDAQTRAKIPPDVRPEGHQPSPHTDQPADAPTGATELGGESRS